ncbi:MAG: GNAT family N-acetyltransferase [Chloroflexaceae bacterium]|nr:GNAT family N-acetyltransferase [Chloroflexaceae bacterium]
MPIQTVDPTTDPLWLRFVLQHRSDVFHSPGWLRAIQETYDIPTRAYVITDDQGEPVAGMAFCQIEDIAGKRIAALPFSDYCDPLIDTAEQWQLCANRLLEEQCPLVVRPLHNEIPLSDERFTLYNQAKWHGLDLTSGDTDALWKHLDEGSRRAIRKARKNGVEVHRAEGEQGAEQLRAFFDLHLKIRKYKYRLLAQPYRFFENIWRYCVEQNGGFLMVATLEQEIIGTIYFLIWKQTMYYKFNASSPDHLNYRPNDTMLWEGIQYAKEQGYTYMDFGLSDWDQEGLIRYKRKFATDEKTISFLRFMPEGQPSAQTGRIRGLMPKLTDLFTDEQVPDTVTEQAGDILYRFFS